MPLQLLRLLFLVGLLVFFSSGYAAKGVNVVLPSWFKNSLYDFQGDLQDAHDAGKRGILLFFSEKSCSYCNAIIETTFKQPDIVKRLRANYDVIGIEVFSDIEVVDTVGKTHWAKDFAVLEKAQFTPTLIFYHASGAKQLRLVGYQSPEKFRGTLDYLEDEHAKSMNLRAYLKQRDAVSQTKNSPATKLELTHQGGKHKPLLVVFESADCLKCPQLRAMLNSASVKPYAQQLRIEFVSSDDDNARITIADGKAISGKNWSNNLGLIHHPAMVFFDESGKEAFRVDTDILVDQHGKDVSNDDPLILANISARLQYFLSKGYQTLPQFQRWRAQQKRH